MVSTIESMKFRGCAAQWERHLEGTQIEGYAIIVYESMKAIKLN